MSTVLKVVGASWMQTKISSYILGILGILAILALFVGQMERIQADGTYAATVFYSEKMGYRIEFWGQSNELSDIARGVARAYFRRDADTTGWALLEVETDPSYPDEVQAYAAGVVEGALTWSLIHAHLDNTIRDKCDDTPLNKQCNKIKDAIDQSVDSWTKYAAEHCDEDPLLHQVFLHYKQIGGIWTGWKHGVERSMQEYETDKSDLYWLNSLAEIVELERKFNFSVQNSALENLPDLSTAFLRVVNESSEHDAMQKIFVAQNAVGSYSSMIRILKRYKLNYHYTNNSTDLIPGTSVEFTSYPGSIVSHDTFYLVRGNEHKMAVTGTPLRNYNNKLWKEVNITDQIPLGPRLSAANHLATNTSTWAHILASSNSGTASKQWMVVDLNRFEHLHGDTKNETKHAPSQIVTKSTFNKYIKHTVVHRANTGHTKGVVMLVEQVPGLTHSADLTDAFLEKGYWATYGLPFFENVAENTHIYKMEERYGDIFSESDSPRAVLFKRGFKNATSLDSIIKLMRQNNVTAMNRASNETSHCADDMECLLRDNGYWSVLGVRGDVVARHREAYGVIDTKIVTSSQRSSLVELVAVAGPPYTAVEKNSTLINKGNVAPYYTEKFNNRSDISGFEIRDLVKHMQEEDQQEALDNLNRDAVQPFQWSESDFANLTHTAHPDRWAFAPYKTNWSW